MAIFFGINMCIFYSISNASIFISIFCFIEDIDNLLKQTHNSTNDLMKVLLESTREDTLAISLAELDRLFRELNFRSSHEDVTKAFER